MKVDPPVSPEGARSIPSLLREAITVLDEPYHRESVARLLEEAADTIERERLDHQETRGAVAAWKQEYARLERKLATSNQGAADAGPTAPNDLDRFARGEFGGPIPLTEAQEQAIKDWAADDRLWTTQETVETNLRTFARLMLKQADRRQLIELSDDNRSQPIEVAVTSDRTA